MAAHGPLPHAVLGLETRRPGQRAQLAALPDHPGRTEQASAPESLGDAGRAAWDAALASAPWLTTDADLLLVAQWAQLCDEQALLRSVLSRGHRTTAGSRGQRVDSPHVAQLRAVEATILKYAQALGLGPMNRGRLGVPLAPRPRPATVSGDELAAARAALEATR